MFTIPNFIIVKSIMKNVNRKKNKIANGHLTFIRKFSDAPKIIHLHTLLRHMISDEITSLKTKAIIYYKGYLEMTQIFLVTFR